VVTVTGLSVPQPAEAARPVYLGATQGGVEQLERQTGEDLASHAYGTFDGGVPQGRMITVRAPGTKWSTVANARSGSALYKNIVRWADTIRSRPGPIYLAFHHEPEAAGSTGYGTAAEFAAAYRRVVEIFRSRNVTNVEWTWQMTAWSFRVQSSDRRAAAKWYPGNNYVDVVGADAYNWGSCGSGVGRWVPLSTLADPVVDFAQARGKLAALPEFGANTDPRRDEWLRDVHNYLQANRSSIAAAFYFNRPPTNQDNTDCRWMVKTQEEISAYRNMARDGMFATN
jgi:beta-mannanase